MSGDLRRSLETRRGDVERDRAIAGGIYVVDGVIDLLGTGEVTVDVSFPVTFTEMPFVTGGGAAAPNQRIVPGEFPTWRVGVRAWDLIINPAAPDNPRYKGCTLVVVVDGSAADAATFKSFAFWMARGRALTNPIVGGL